MAVRLPEWLRLKGNSRKRLGACQRSERICISHGHRRTPTADLTIRRVRILQQASVMLGHCRMRSLSKPQLHARSAVGSSGPDEPRGWAGEGRSSPARKSVPANRIDGGWLLDLKGRRRAFYTTKLPALKTPAPRSFFALRSKKKTQNSTDAQPLAGTRPL